VADVGGKKGMAAWASRFSGRCEKRRGRFMEGKGRNSCGTRQTQFSPYQVSSQKSPLVLLGTGRSDFKAHPLWGKNGGGKIPGEGQ